jgi:hypothetical protein
LTVARGTKYIECPMKTVFSEIRDSGVEASRDRIRLQDEDRRVASGCARLRAWR